jgi:N-acetylglutamate synthase-like GNAT family acetyltransferase
MSEDATEHMMQCGRDIVRLLGRAPKGKCKVDEYGWLGLSGEQGTADLNMAFVARTAPASVIEEYAGAVRDQGLNAILIVDEDAPELVEAGTNLGLVAVGNVPVMEWKDKPAPTPSSKYNVRRAAKEDMPTGAMLVAQAFSLDEAALQRAAPPELLDDGVDFWLVEDDGEAVGTGSFIREGDHVGVYTMATPERNQRRGIGRAVLDGAMSQYINEGATRFTLEATEAGFHLYEQVGFETVAAPTVLLIGESTQFPG